MKITDEMVKAAREAYATYGQAGDLRASPPSEGVVTAMLTAALAIQTKQGVEVKKLDLEITKEWFERRAKAEADLEIGAGFSVVNPTDADLAQMEVLAERGLPKWAQDELARLRSALVDVPAVESEPVAWQWEEDLINSGRYTLMWDDEPPGEHPGIRNVTPLFAHPPRSLSNEGHNVEDLTRPIIGFEHRTPQEVFDIMADRIRIALSTRKGSAGDGSAPGTTGASPSSTHGGKNGE